MPNVGVVLPHALIASNVSMAPRGRLLIFRWTRMASIDSEELGTGSRTPPVSAWAAVALGVLAFVLANWPLVHRVEVADIETVSTGLNLLLAGALPWFLQWAALALAFGLLAKRMTELDRSLILAVVLVPLVIGTRSEEHTSELQSH